MERIYVVASYGKTIYVGTNREWVRILVKQHKVVDVNVWENGVEIEAHQHRGTRTYGGTMIWRSWTINSEGKREIIHHE